MSRQALTLEEMESEVAFELPDREMLGLVTVVITNVLNNLDVEINVNNNKLAIQVCAVVSALNTILVPPGTAPVLICEIQQ